jgi:hypothetical protein
MVSLGVALIVAAVILGLLGLLLHAAHFLLVVGAVVLVIGLLSMAFNRP